jgi:hypothetical protein
MISPQPTLAMMMTLTLQMSYKLDKITSVLLLNATEVATMKANTTAILKIDDDIEEYHRELQLILDVQKQIQIICTDDTHYA